VPSFSSTAREDIEAPSAATASLGIRDVRGIASQTSSDRDMATVYKIVAASQWRDALREGVFRGSTADLRDGYIHLSTAAQVQETAAKHFAGQRDLLLIGVDATRLGSALKWEPSRGGALFPHLYGVLTPAAVTRVEPLPLAPDGRHVFPPLDS
jgi:uncharacterized protein (DUF952 family)